MPTPSTGTCTALRFAHHPSQSVGWVTEARWTVRSPAPRSGGAAYTGATNTGCGHLYCGQSFSPPLWKPLWKGFGKPSATQQQDWILKCLRVGEPIPSSSLWLHRLATLSSQIEFEITNCLCGASSRRQRYCCCSSRYTTGMTTRWRSPRALSRLVKAEKGATSSWYIR
jgi:hypothetical protein